MLFGNKKILGLDIGTTSIKIAEVEGSGASAKLVSFGMVPTPIGAIAGEEILEPHMLAEAIQAVAAELNTKRKKASVGLSGASIVIKRISIPRMDEGLVGEQIRWEAEQYIPYDINEVNLEYKILENVSDSQETMDILLVAAVQENVFRLAEVVEMSGLSCSIVDVAGFAVTNCFEANYGLPSGEVFALLNVGASATNFVVIESGEIVFCRDIPAAGHLYTTELQKGLGISFEEAEALKLSVSLGQPAPEEAGQVLDATHDIFLDELSSSVEFYQNTSTAAGISRAFVTGGGARMPGLLAVIGKQFPAEPFNPFHKVGFNRKKISPGYLDSIQDFCAVSIGLGLRKVGDC